MTTRLSAKTLASLQAQAAIPRYDRSQLTAGIVHFGIGNFHRAHQAVYLDDLFNTGKDHDWALVGAGVLPSDEAMRKILADQDYLTTVVEQDAKRSSARITGPMIDYLNPSDRPAILAKLADPAIRIVSLTITEGGYFIDPASGRFNPAHPDIVADAAAPDEPKTVFGLIVAGLKRRRDKAIPPFTVMSCDNIPHNGAVTKEAVTGLAALSDPAFSTWIDGNVAFPNGMVDRITPATSDANGAYWRMTSASTTPGRCSAKASGSGCWRTTSPPADRRWKRSAFSSFPTFRPTNTMKIRILNGGHAIIAYPAGLMDIHFVHEAMENDWFAPSCAKVEREEIIPVVPPVPDTDLGDYFDLIERRFANPKIGDTVRRLCLDGSNRQPKFILPTIGDRLAKGLDIKGLALESALWCRYCFGSTDSGKEIAPNDPSWDRLQEAAKAARLDPLAWLAMDDIYGEIGQSKRFRAAFAHALKSLWTDGTVHVLKQYLDGNL